ncbi:MAG: MFS transporter [Thermoleophilia bacterium]|nr:MFS transporter [Thermoleophilia bacterium]
MTAHATSSGPSLRQRLPLYPSQVIGAMIMASLGPLLDSIMTDLGIPLSRGGIISAGFFVGGVLSIVVLNSAMARVPAKRMLVFGMLLQGLGLVIAGLVSWDLWSVTLACLLGGFGGNFVNTMC